MDPITGFLTLAGVGISIFGSMNASHEQNKAAEISRQNTGLEIQENQQRQLAMQISARRQRTEILRQSQQAAARGLAAGVNQGASGRNSSGIAGGRAQIIGEADYNLQGIDQNESIGNTLFGLQNQISQNQIQMSYYQSKAATDTGIASIGSTLAGYAGPLGKMLGNFFQPGQDNGQSYNPAMAGIMGGAGGSMNG